MKPPTKIAIIGAGGITCHLMSCLSLDYPLVLVDEDRFEPSNSKRQWPALKGSGTNKAEYLAAEQRLKGFKNIQAIPEYLRDISIVNRPEWKGVDFIFGCVDNNQSRRIIVELCDSLDIPAILCGNETEMGEAHLVLQPDYDPFDHHDFGPMTRAPFSCTSDELGAAAPQTAIANFMAAACGLHILASWNAVDKKENLVVHSRMDRRAQSCRTRLRDLMPNFSTSSSDQASESQEAPACKVG